MKKILNTLILIPALLALASCDKFLDKMPDTRTVLDTPQKLSQMLTSGYNTTLPLLMCEFMSDNISDSGHKISVGKDLYQEAYLYREISSTGTDTPSSVWEDNYGTVAAANLVLEAIETFDWGGNDVSGQKGEALLLRAFGHFNLTLLFCQAYSPEHASSDLGVPYVFDTETTVYVNRKRETLEKTYQLIAADIEAGFPLLRDDAYERPKFHFTKKAAAAFATQFYLYYQKYDKAVEYANYALGNDPSALFRDWSFQDNMSSSKEFTYAYVDSDVAANFLEIGFSSYEGRCKNSRYCLTSGLVNLTYRPNSGPWGTTYLPGYSKSYQYDSGRACFYPKINEYFMYTNVEAGIGIPYIVTVLFSVEKTLIDAAEAYALSGDYDNAAKYLSLFYASAGGTCGMLDANTINSFYKSEAGQQYVSNIAGVTIEDEVQRGLVDAVLHARRVATTHEGTRLQDIKRYGITFVHEVDLGANLELEARDKRLVAQLPRLVISAGMTPNP